MLSLNLSVALSNSGGIPPIGSLYLGGKVAYICTSAEAAASGIRGIVAALTDQSAGTAWSADTTHACGATETDLGSGMRNTAKIITQNTTCAAILCTALGDGWGMPNITELDKLRLAGVLLGINMSSNYWSSSEDTAINTLRRYMGGTTIVSSLKTQSYRVRAIKYIY